MGFVIDMHNAISDINCKGAKNRSSCRRKIALPPMGMDTLLCNVAPLPVKELILNDYMLLLGNEHFPGVMHI